MSEVRDIVARPRKDHMTRVSTALLIIGPKSIPPWADRSWQVAASAQLVEGSIPYWIVTPTQPAQHPVTPNEIEVTAPHADSVVESILLLLATHFGDEDVAVNLAESHNIELGNDNVRRVAEFYELSDHSRTFIASRLSESVRLGLTQLDDFSLVNDEVVQELRGLGFDVEVYEPRFSSSF